MDNNRTEPTRALRILVDGAYTIDSAGDDAALDALLRAVERHTVRPLDVRVLCRHANSGFGQFFGVTAIQNLEYETRELSVGRWLRGFNPGDPPELLLNLAEHFEWADVVVLGAGNFLNEGAFGLFRGMLARFSISQFVAKLTGKPTMLYALSASHISTGLGRLMARWLLRSADVVTFRENHSVELLRECGIEVPERATVLHDPVVLSPASGNERVDAILSAEGVPAHPDSSRLAVSVRGFAHLGALAHDEYLEKMRSVVARWLAEGGEVLFIPQCTYEHSRPTDDDRVVAAQVMEGLPHARRVHSLRGKYWSREIEAVYRRCDVALCTRLHGNVFAFKQGVPVVGLAYEPKVSGFWDQANLPEQSLPMTASATRIYEEICRAAERYPHQRAKESFARMKQESLRYGEFVMSLLDRSAR